MLRSLLTTFAATTLLAATTTAPAGATSSTPHGCTDLHQIGQTAYIRWNGMTIFSVRQYASPHCDLRYGEAYAWLQFRQRHIPYELGVALFDDTHNRYLDARQFTPATGTTFWSTAATPHNTCTQATAEAWPPNEDLAAQSTRVC
jgi:hypothetical protein